jgi:DNA-binding NtrC family response regulator
MDDQTKRRILFVDDEPMVLKGLQRSLRKMRNEWEMTFTSSSKQALDILDSGAFDVIVSDLRMPEIDGVQLLAEVKSRHPHVVRIVLSGQVEQESNFNSVKVAHQSLSKPCDADILKHTLKNCLVCETCWKMNRSNASSRKPRRFPACRKFTPR